MEVGWLTGMEKVWLRPLTTAASLAIAGLLLAWGMPFSGLPETLFPGAPVAARVGRELIWWTFGGVLLAYVLLVERRPLRSINLKLPTFSTLLWGCIFVVPLMASVMLCYGVILPMLDLRQDMATTHSIVALPLWLQTATMLRAGVVEEILFRGYPIERLTSLTGKRWPAAIISGAIFVAAHVSGWAASQLIVVAFGTFILTGLYLWRRDLMACMIAHALTDIIGFALARAYS